MQSSFFRYGLGELRELKIEDFEPLLIERRGKATGKEQKPLLIKEEVRPLLIERRGKATSKGQKPLLSESYSGKKIGGLHFNEGYA